MLRASLLAAFFLVTTYAQAQEVLARFQQQRDAGGRFGRAMAGFEADVNGDGILDILVTSAAASSENAEQYAGRCYFLSGKTGKSIRMISAPREAYGISCGSLRDDLNRDEETDAWIGDADTVFVISGLNGQPLQAIPVPLGEKRGRWGESVATLGDLNGDTLSDLVIHTDKGIYAWNVKENRLLYHTPLAGTKQPHLLAPTLRRQGDVTGDGTSEWLISRLEGDKPIVWMGNGATGKTLYSVTSPNPGKDQFGWSVVSLRDDINDDDINDFAVAAPLTTLGSQIETGMVHVFSGKDGKRLYSIAPNRPQIRGNFGYFLEAIYDRDGDCIQDLLIGDRSGDGKGALAIYSGKTGKWIEEVQIPFDENTTTGKLVGIASAGGDIDRNNSEDILLNISYEQARPNELVILSPKTLYPPLKIYPNDSIRLDYAAEDPIVLSATVSPAFKSYQWYFNNEPIPGATDSKLEVGAGGVYTVRVPIPCIELLEASVNVPVPPSDTPVHVLLGRVMQVDREIIVHNREIEVRVWDDKKEDGDIISLNFNGKWILKDHLLSWNQKVVPLSILEGQENIFAMYALNQGSIPPNTAAISIKDGKETHFFVIRSDFRRSGTVRIVYKPK